MRFVLLAALIFALPLTASAQEFDLSSFGAAPEQLGGVGDVNPFKLEVSPRFPVPRSKVVVTARSTSIDLANATMSVTVNGASIHKGAVRSVEVPLGAAGALTTIKVTITSSGKSYNLSATVRPEDVVLILEPLASAPPLYSGKPLEAIGGKVRVVAMPSFRTAQGALLDSSQLSYAWTVDGARQAEHSGIGKSTIIVSSPQQYRSRTVSVTVQSQDGVYVSGAEATLRPAEPTLRLYQNDPLLGIRFERALADSYAISTAEAPLYAALYSFPVVATPPTVSWYLNGSLAESGPLITLRPTGRGKGSATLSVVASIEELAQVTRALSLSFGTASTNLFGL